MVVADAEMAERARSVRVVVFRQVDILLNGERQGILSLQAGISVFFAMVSFFLFFLFINPALNQ